MIFVVKVIIFYSLTVSVTEALIGEEIDEEEYSRLKFCESEVCREDSDRLVKYASVYHSTDPCLDFTQVVCSNFFTNFSHDDRYLFVGFERDWRSSALMLIHEALTESIKTSDVKAVKVVKNFYQKCIDEEYIVTESRNNLRTYLESFGTFPAYAQNNWNESQLNFQKILEEFNFALIYNYVLVLCDDSSNSICIKKYGDDYGIFNRDGSLDYFGVGTYKNLFDTMNNFNLTDDKINASLANYWKHRYGQPLMFESDKGIVDQPFNIFSIINPAKPEEMLNWTVKDFKDKIVDKNWLKLFNSNLPETLQITEADTIRVPKRFVEHALKFERNFSKEIVADALMVGFLNHERNFIELEPFDHNDRHETRRAWPRREKCGHLVGRQSYMSVAVDALVIRRFLNEERRQNFKKIIEMVRDQMINEPNRTNDEKLENLNLYIGYKNQRVIADEYLDTLYANLTLDGSENLFVTTRKVRLFEDFMTAQMRHLSDDDKILFEVATQFYHTEPIACVFLMNKNYYYCPWGAMIDPAFNVNRSMFFNMAVANPRIFSNFQSALGVKANLKNEVSFKVYQKWLQENKEDRHLKGFGLGDEHMFWFSLIHVICKKYLGFDFIGNKSYSDVLVPESPNELFFKTFDC